jgi:hypothetical protein
MRREREERERDGGRYGVRRRGGKEGEGRQEGGMTGK